jgi:hypothetical protein
MVTISQVGVLGVGLISYTLKKIGIKQNLDRFQGSLADYANAVTVKGKLDKSFPFTGHST